MKKLVALIAIVILPSLAWAGTSPHQVVESYFKYLDKGDAENASKLVSDRLLGGLKPNNRIRIIESKMKPIRSHGGISNLAITNEKASDTSVVMSIDIVYKDKTTAKKRVVVKNESGQWKLRDL